MSNESGMNRREAMASMVGIGVGLSSAGSVDWRPAAPDVAAHDASLSIALNAQVTDKDSPWRGASPDRWGLHHCGSASRILRDGAAAFLHSGSKFFGSPDLLARMRLAVGYLERFQTRDGNIDLLTTNFNSPPDTGFVVHGVGRAARLAQLHRHDELLSLMKPFLVSAGQGMAEGGIHTPNHRWVISAALAQIHEVFPDDRYVKRIDQWLAEGIDIDEEGQFIERSTTVYNAISDYAFIVMAHKLGRPDLLDPVRRNLDAMAYLVHPDGEVVTETSRRQDVNQRGTMSRYWFSLRYMAIHDRNGLYAAMLRPLEPDRIQLSALMEYPELSKDLPPSKPLPDDFEKPYASAEITRIRKGKTSMTLMHQGNSRWISVHHGLAVLNAVSFATAFFGKGQFVPESFEKRKDGFHFRQELSAPYHQPLTGDDLIPINRANWFPIRETRVPSEVNRIVYEGCIKIRPEGFELSVSAQGTDRVPIAIEINLRPGGQLKGVTPAPHVDDAYLLRDGDAEYRVRIGPDPLRSRPRGARLHASAWRPAQAPRPERLPHRLHPIPPHPALQALVTPSVCTVSDTESHYSNRALAFRHLAGRCRVHVGSTATASYTHSHHSD